MGIEGARTYVDRHLDDWSPASTGDKFQHWISAGHIALPADRSRK